MRRTADLDRLSLTAGLALVVLGTVLLLDALGVVRLSFGSMAPIAFAAVGAILLASGLSRGSAG
ncbi:MAG: hypothetical protein QOI73_433 [Solirubrobacteraceae bacterium]|nr:hypothetical protein [Solirubrobacteraceae bacterium]